MTEKTRFYAAVANEAYTPDAQALKYFNSNILGVGKFELRHASEHMNVYHRVDSPPFSAQSAKMLVGLSGTNSTWDVMRDVSVVMNYRGYAHGTQLYYNNLLDGLYNDLSIKLNEAYVEYGIHVPICFSGHSLGAKLALDLRFRVLQADIANNIDRSLIVYGYSVFGFMDDNLEAQLEKAGAYLQDEATGQDNGNAQYSKMITETFTRITENDVVSSLWLHGAIGYGTCEVRPAKAGILNDELNVITFGTYNSNSNHSISNYLYDEDTPNPYFTPILQHPYMLWLDQDGHTQSELLTENKSSIFLMNAKPLTNGTQSIHIKARVNDDNDGFIGTVYGLSGDGNVNTTAGIETKFILDLTTMPGENKQYFINVDTDGNPNVNDQTVAMFFTLSHPDVNIPFSQQVLFEYRKNDDNNNPVYIIRDGNNLSKKLVMAHNINSRADVPEAGVDISFISHPTPYTQEDAILRSTWSIENSNMLNTNLSITDNDRHRRTIYDISALNHVPPLGISNMTPYSDNYMNFATPNVLNLHDAQKFAIFNKHYKKFLKYDGNAHNWSSLVSPERTTGSHEAILNNYSFVDSQDFASVISVGSGLLYKYNTHPSSNNQIRLYPCDSSGIVTLAGEFIGKSWHAMNRTVFVKTTDGDNSFWWDGEFGFQSHLQHGDSLNDLMMMRAYTLPNGNLALNAQNDISGGWNGTTYNVQPTTGVPQVHMDEFKWFIYLI